MSDFTEAERGAVYKAISLRRDIRRQFTPARIPAAVLARLLGAAHRAGSVGFMQPWDFIVIRDAGVRRKVLQSFLRERDRSASFYEGPRRELYLSLKLEGILESALNMCVTCDRSRAGPHVLGRSTILDTDPQALAVILGLPDQVVPVAYLCLGYVDAFPTDPELQQVGWRRRLPLAELVHLNRWGGRLDGAWDDLLEELHA